MSTEESIIRLFCRVDDRLGAVKKRSDAHLYDREIVPIGMLPCVGASSGPCIAGSMPIIGICCRPCPN